RVASSRRTGTTRSSPAAASRERGRCCSHEPEPEADAMTESTPGLFTILVLSVFVGFEVISKVSPILHTPLMSGANAIHGVILVGSMIVLGTGDGALELTLGFLAVVLATVNVVG